MQFGSVICDRCGNKIDVDSIDYSNKRVLCPVCMLLKTGKEDNEIICNDCRFYNIKDGICSYEGFTVAPHKKCCSSRAKWGV